MLAARSRHKWTVLTLPPRQAARRLAVSGTWFGEQLALHPPRVVPKGEATPGQRPERIAFDVIVGGDLLNVADLRRRFTRLADVPLVIRHFGPTPADARSRGVRRVALKQADEVWCAHARAKAGLIEETRTSGYLDTTGVELDLPAKTQIVPPPVGGGGGAGPANTGIAGRTRQAVAVDATGPVPEVVGGALRRLAIRGEKMQLTLIGRVGTLPDEVQQHGVPVKRVAATDPAAVGAVLARCRSFVGGFANRPTGADTTGIDPLVVRALRAGCWTMLLDTPAHRELLAPFHHSSWLHKNEPHRVHAWLMTALKQGMPSGGDSQQATLLRAFDPAAATARADARLDAVARTRVAVA